MSILSMVLVLYAGLWQPAFSPPLDERPTSQSVEPTSQPTTLPADAGRTISFEDIYPLPANAALPPDILFDRASPAVVKLTIRDEDDREIGIASGFIVKFERKKYDIQGQGLYDSTIVTNYHVIRPAISIEFSFPAGRGGPISLVLAEDESADIAVLLASSVAQPERALKLQDGANPPIGTKVYAIGSPQGLSNTLSEGLISGYRQRGEHEPWIQITAPISPGSSGGPLFSAKGSVLGVTTAFLSESQNLNFAVPAGEVSRLLTNNRKPRQIWEGARQVWEGASIRRTEKDVFAMAHLRLYSRCLKANPKRIGDDRYDQTFERFWRKQIDTGDQLALLLKGRKLCDSNQYTEAIDLLKRATKADSGEHAYLTHYALAKAICMNLLRSGFRDKELEAVLEPLGQAKKLNPNFGPTFYWLAKTHEMMWKYPEALLEAESLIRLMPRCYQGYQFRGKAWANLGREEAFERDFETACELRPNDLHLLVCKANGYSSLGQLQKAVDTYKDAIKLDESYFLPHLNLGITLQQMGNYDEAIKSYQRALEAAGNNPGPLRSDAERRIAECRRQMRQSP